MDPSHKSPQLVGQQAMGQENLLPHNCNLKSREHRACRPEARHTAHPCVPESSLGDTGPSLLKVLVLASNMANHASTAQRTPLESPGLSCHMSPGHGELHLCDLLFLPVGDIL